MQLLSEPIMADGLGVCARAQVSAMYHIAQAIGGPPLPDGLSHEGRDFLRLCFNRWGASLLGHQKWKSAKTCYSMGCASQQSQHVNRHSAIILLPDPRQLPRQGTLTHSCT